MEPSQAGNESPYLYVFIALFVIGCVVFIVGNLMAVYTPEKQALHDIIARCYVVNGRGQSSSISWKPIVVLAIAVLVSKGIFLLVPETPTKATTSTNTSTENVQESVTPKPSPPPTPTPEAPTVSSIFGELIPPPPAVYSLTNGVRELEFAAGLTQHQAILSINGDSGVMVVRLPNGKGGTQAIWQKMILRQSSKGIVIVGENPIDLDTKKASETYVADNFFIAVSPSEPNKVTFRNFSVHPDNSILESPVQDKFLGYPVIGIRRESSSSQNTDVIIKEVNKDSPASKADLRAGDIIRSVNGTSVSNVSDAQSQIISSLLFSTINFEIKRGGENLSVEVSPECCVTQEQLNKEQSPSPTSPASR
ncbi:PDZ domain-containing protein [Microcoleus sp.]|uniref:PDZ domain-containing protein n=1 Tax=Microcoleus sp. TaxID=44472 RepID=UPI00403E7441